MVEDYLTKDEIYSLKRRLEIAINDPQVMEDTVDRICDWLRDVNMVADGEKGLHCKNCSELEDTIHDLENENENLGDDVYELNIEKDNLEDEVESLKDDLKEANSSIEELQSENKELLNRIDELESELDILEC